MTALRDMLDGVTSGLDWLGRKAGVAVVVVVWVDLLVWRLT